MTYRTDGMTWGAPSSGRLLWLPGNGVLPGERRRMGDAGLAFVVPGLWACSTVGSSALCRASAVQSLRSALAYMWVPASAGLPACLGTEYGPASERKRQVVAAAWGLRTPVLHPGPYAIGLMARQGSGIKEGSDAVACLQNCEGPGGCCIISVVRSTESEDQSID